MSSRSNSSNSLKKRKLTSHVEDAQNVQEVQDDQDVQDAQDVQNSTVRTTMTNHKKRKTSNDTKDEKQTLMPQVNEPKRTSKKPSQLKVRAVDRDHQQNQDNQDNQNESEPIQVEDAENVERVESVESSEHDEHEVVKSKIKTANNKSFIPLVFDDEVEVPKSIPVFSHVIESEIEPKSQHQTEKVADITNESEDGDNSHDNHTNQENQMDQYDDQDLNPEQAEQIVQAAHQIKSAQAPNKNTQMRTSRPSKSEEMRKVVHQEISSQIDNYSKQHEFDTNQSHRSNQQLKSNSKLTNHKSKASKHSKSIVEPEELLNNNHDDQPHNSTSHNEPNETDHSEEVETHNVRIQSDPQTDVLHQKFIRRQLDPDVAFELLILDRLAFVRFLTSMHNILTTCTLVVHPSNSSENCFGSLRINNISDNKCMMMVGSFECLVKCHKSTHFCVDVDQFKTVIDLLNHPNLLISQKVDSGNLAMTCFVNSESYSMVNFNLIEGSVDEDTIDTLDMKMKVTIQRQKLRENIKMCKTLSNDNIHISLYSQPSKNPQIKVYYICFECKPTSLSDSKNRFQDVRRLEITVKQNQTGYIMNNESETSKTSEFDLEFGHHVVDFSNMECVVNHAYNHTFMDYFLNNLSGDSVTLHLGPGMPMLIRNDFTEKSHITFVMAPLSTENTL